MFYFSIETNKVQGTKVLLSRYNTLRLASLDNFRTDLIDYQQRVRSYIYLTILTQLDIAFPLRRLSYYLTNPIEFYLKALKGLIRYLRLIIDLRLEFSYEKGKPLIGFLDSNYVIDKQDRVSILRNIFILRGYYGHYVK